MLSGVGAGLDDPGFVNRDHVVALAECDSQLGPDVPSDARAARILHAEKRGYLGGRSLFCGFVLHCDDSFAPVFATSKRIG